MKFIQKKINGLELMAIHFKNELKTIFTDSGAMLILIGAMIIYPIIYSIGYLNETLTELPIGVVDLDHSPASRKYTNMIDASSDLLVNCKPEDLKSAESLFLENKINGVVLIPKGFQKEVFSGQQANVAIYADASYFLKYKNEFMAVSYANAYFSGGIAIKKYMAEGKSFQQASTSNNPLSIQTHILYNPSSAYGSFIMPGMILIIIQQTLLIGIGLLGGSFSESKESPFLLSLKNRNREIIPYLTGKSAAYLLISLFNLAFAVVLVHHWFNYPDKASMIDVMMLLFPYLLSTIVLGIGISSFFMHRESAIVFMVFLSPIALFLSGLSWPVSAIPEWLVYLSKLMPSTTAVPAYLRLRTMGAGLADVKNEVIGLYCLTGIYALITLAHFYFRTYFDKRKQMAKT
jgi:ABC-2 type transport system permease protein